jgi:hypothetical protein
MKLVSTLAFELRVSMPGEVEPWVLAGAGSVLGANTVSTFAFGHTPLDVYHLLLRCGKHFLPLPRGGDEQ